MEERRYSSSTEQSSLAAIPSAAATFDDPSPEEKVTCCQKFKYILANTWKFWFSILVPILLCLIFLYKPNSQNKDFSRVPHALYLLTFMAAYWVSECIPLAITSLIPMFLAPIFSIASTDAVCGAFMNHTLMFLFGGCIVALSFEYSDLHTRISFFVMKLLGARPPTLLFGMMMTCMVLSCWMNNTSTTAMMVPVIIQIVEQYKSNMIPMETPEELARMKRASVSSKQLTPDTAPESIERTPSLEAGNNELLPPADEPVIPDQGFEEDVKFWEEEIATNTAYIQKLNVMFLLGVAASSNIGGTGVITGTGTNLIAQKELADFRQRARGEGDIGKFQDYQHCIARPTTSNPLWELDFTKWMQYNVAIMFVNTVLAWGFLSIYFLGCPHAWKDFFRTKICRKQPDLHACHRAEKVKQLAGEIKAAIKLKYKSLGKTTFHQYMVFILFMMLVVLWIFRLPAFLKPNPSVFMERHGRTAAEIVKTDPKCAKVGPPSSIGGPNVYSKYRSEWGWGRYFGDECDPKYIHDYVPTMLVIVLLMVLPKEPRYYKGLAAFEKGLSDPLLPYWFIAAKSPWGPLFMLGGGFAMSAALTESNFKDLLGQFMRSSTVMQQIPPAAMLGMALVFVGILTSIASNTATAVIMTPILIELARLKSLPPMFMVIPPIVGASYAFCLPISTPPNAIVYDKGNMHQLDMFVPGLFLTIMSNLVLWGATISLTYYMMGVDVYNGSCNYGPNA